MKTKEVNSILLISVDFFHFAIEISMFECENSRQLRDYPRLKLYLTNLA